MKDSFKFSPLSTLFRWTASLSLLFFFLNHKPLEAQIPVSLDSCLKAILAKHPLALQAKIKLEKAAFLERQFPPSSLPNVLATIRTHNSWGLFIDPTTNELVRDRNFGTSSELEIDFPIFQGLSARYQRDVRQWELTAAQWEINRIERDILIELIPVFYDALLNQE